MKSRLNLNGKRGAKGMFGQVEKISILDPSQNDRWDEFVEHHPDGWICHLVGWKRLIEDSYTHIKGYYLVKHDPLENRICAGLPIYFVKSLLTGKRLVCAPFASLFDPLYSNENELRFLSDAAIQLYDKYRASFLEIRSFKSIEIENDQRFKVNHSYKHHYLELNEEPEILKKSFHRTCIRQRINRALESNIQLKVGKNKQDLNDFYFLYLLTRKRTKLPPMPRRFFHKMWDEFFPSGKVSLLLAQYEKEIIAGMILFKYKGRVSVEFAASNEQYKNISPNHFLFWHAINLAYEQGFSIFDFGRTSKNNASLLDFKRHWGTLVVDLPQYIYNNNRNIDLKSTEDKMGYKLVKKIGEFVPLSIYPIFGEFCYRHLG